MPPLAEAAKRAGVGTSTLHKAISGGDVRLSTAVRLLEGIGGDFARSLPPELRPPELAAPEENGAAPLDDAAFLAGTVRCGEVRWAPENERVRLDLRPLGVARRERWELGEGPCLALRTADSAAGWPEGSLLLARKWREGAEPPADAEFTAICQMVGGPAWRLLKLVWLPDVRRYIVRREGGEIKRFPNDTLVIGAIVAGAVVPA